MSFFSGVRTDYIPGPILNNPLHGLCEKVCIQVKKVFDACLRQEHVENQELTIQSFEPANPTFPLTFVSGQSSVTDRAFLTNLVVTRFNDRPNFARVSGTANIPVDIVYTDANNVQGVASAVLSLPVDVVLFMPQPSIIPNEVELVASAMLASANFTSETTVVVEGCVLLIIKVIAETELLVPSYGYCHIPPCQEFSQNVCDGFFDMPLFPSTAPVANNENNNNNANNGGFNLFG